MTIAERPSLSKSLVVSTATVWIASVLCFSLLAFRSGLLVRTLGPTLTYLLVALAYPLVVAFPLATVVVSKGRARFVAAFSVVFMLAVAVMILFLKLLPGLVGGYIAGVVAISTLGSGIACYLDRRSAFLTIGFVLGCWAFVGDYAGYHARDALGGMQGVVAYATTYSAFLGSGLGAVVWYVQRRTAV